MAITFSKILQAMGVPDTTIIRFMYVAYDKKKSAPDRLISIMESEIAKWEKANGKITELDRPKNDPWQKLMGDKIIRIAYDEAKERDLGNL